MVYARAGHLRVHPWRIGMDSGLICVPEAGFAPLTNGSGAIHRMADTAVYVIWQAHGLVPRLSPVRLTSSIASIHPARKAWSGKGITLVDW